MSSAVRGPVRVPVRAVAARLRRDVTFTAMHAGLRAATGTAAPLALAYVTGNRGYILAAVGGWFTALADVGGVTRTRVRTMSAYVLLGGIAYASGARAAGIAVALRASDMAWLAVLFVAALVFCWAVGAALLRVLGDAGSTLGILVAATFVAALAGPAAHASAALAGGLMIAGGGLWTMFLALAVWPVRPYSAARHGVGDAYHALAHFATGIARSAVDGAASGDVVLERYTTLARREHPRVRTAIEAGRSVLLATRRGRLGAAPRGDDLALLLDGADLVFGTLLALAEASEVAVVARDSDVDALAAAVARAGVALDELAAAIVPGPRAGRRPPTLARLEADPVPRSGGALVERITGEIERAAEVAATLASGGEDTLLVAARGTVRAWWTGRARRSGVRRSGRAVRGGAWRRALADVDAPALQHALRFGTAAALAHVLGAGLHIARGPWVTITTLIVLQPSAGMTLRRSAARVLGTVLGGAVAAVLAAALHDARLIAVVVFPLAAAAVALRVIHYGVYTFFLTPVFVLIA
ncbi:MAG TPA: FUSC family protein, partial [Gemmatirosa sp.]